MAQSSTSIQGLLDALQVELDAVNKQIRQCNNTIVAQANELTILHNIICQSCKCNFLGAMLEPNSFLSPPGSRPLHGLPDLSSSSPTPQAASSTSVHQASLPVIPAFPVPSHPTPEVSASQSSSRLISTTLPPHPGTPSKTAAALHHDPPPEPLGKTETTVSGALSSSDTNARPTNPKHISQFPWSVTHDPMADKMLDITFERAFTHEDQVKCVKFSLDGKYVGVGLSGGGSHRPLDGRVLVYSTETGKRVCHLVEHTKEERSRVRPICFSPNGEQVAVGYADGQIKLWIIITKRVRNIFRVRRQVVNSLDFSPNGQNIVSASGNSVHVWSLRDGSSRSLKDNDADRTRYLCVRFSPDGKYIAAADWDGFLRIWDSRSHQLVMKWCGQEKCVTCLAFTPDGMGLITGGFGRTVKYWRVTMVGDNRSLSTMSEVTLFRQFDRHVNSISSIAIAADGRWLLSASEDGTARLWNISNGMQQCSVQGHPGWIWSVDISPVGNYLAIGDSKGQVSLWRYKVTNCG